MRRRLRRELGRLLVQAVPGKHQGALPQPRSFLKRCTSVAAESPQGPARLSKVSAAAAHHAGAAGSTSSSDRLRGRAASVLHV